MLKITLLGVGLMGAPMSRRLLGAGHALTVWNRSPDKAQAIAAGMNAYLAGIPEPLYVLFGTGYLGYTAARQWGKVKGVDK